MKSKNSQSLRVPNNADLEVMDLDELGMMLDRLSDKESKDRARYNRTCSDYIRVKNVYLKRLEDKRNQYLEEVANE